MIFIKICLFIVIVSLLQIIRYFVFYKNIYIWDRLVYDFLYLRVFLYLSAFLHLLVLLLFHLRNLFFLNLLVLILFHLLILVIVALIIWVIFDTTNLLNIKISTLVINNIDIKIYWKNTLWISSILFFFIILRIIKWILSI